jgi:desulfoferrodoxin (superoxide reductase-like protein)
MMNKMAVGEEDQFEDESFVDENSEQEESIDDSSSVNDELESDVSETNDDESDEVIVSIGEEAPPPEEQSHAPEWVRELRKTNRELQKQNRELHSRLQTTAQTETKPVTLGAKPKLEDHDYDVDQFEAALASWFDRKRQVDEVVAKQEAEAVNQQKAWQSKLDGYSKAKAELKVKNFEDAELVAQELLSITQQGIVLQGADNPALIVYALGKNLKKAKELSEITDPVKFAFAVAKLEKDLKVTNRKSAPPPERVVSGTGRSSGSVDSTLERLREEASRTGNMTKVIQYKKQKQAASK